MKISLSKRSGFVFFVIPALKIYLMQMNNFIDNFFDIWGVISFAVLLFFTIKSKGYRKFPKGFLLIWAFVAIYVFATATHYRNYLVSVISLLSRMFIIPLYLILTYNMGIVKFKQALIRLRGCFEFLIFIDCTVTLLSKVIMIFDDQRLTIFGLVNYSAFTVLPLLVVIFYISQLLNGKFAKTDIWLYFGELLCKILMMSMTATIALLLFGGLLYLSKHIKFFSKIINPKIILAIIVVCFIGILTIDIQNVFSGILNYFGKGLTLNSRTTIWEYTLRAIPRSPIIGFGAMESEEYKNIVGFSLMYSSSENHPHSLYLAILFYTGIIGCLLYGTLLWRCFAIVKNYWKDSCAIILNIGLVCYLVLGFADDYIFIPFIYIVYTLILIQKRIINDKHLLYHEKNSGKKY